MKVICIDNSIKNTYYSNDAKKLVEGNVYTVIDNPHPIGYILKEVSTPNPNGFLSSRFIPLSEIDELELVNEKELTN